MTAALAIESVTTTLLDLPLRRPHRVATGTIEHQSAVLVRLRTAGGIEGVGEAVVPGGPWWGGECIEGVKILIDSYLAPLLLGQDAGRVEQVTRRLDVTIRGARFAKAGVEMAMWDALGKALDAPLHRVFGGPCREWLDVTWALGAEPAATVVEEIQGALDAGTHRSFKLKMGAVEPGADVGRVRAVADALAGSLVAHAAGPAPLRVDLNDAWDEPTATRWLPALEDAGIGVVEQPVPAWNVDALARLADRLTVPVMADESACTPQDAMRLVGTRAADMLAVKIAKAGGLGAARRMVTVAEAGAVACHGGTTLESSVGTAACAQLFCSLPGLDAGSELFGPLLLAEDIVEQPVDYVDGRLRLPAGPGLGVTLDEKAVTRFTRP